jgi:hypothetical protein
MVTHSVPMEHPGVVAMRPMRLPLPRTCSAPFTDGELVVVDVPGLSPAELADLVAWCPQYNAYFVTTAKGVLEVRVCVCSLICTVTHPKTNQSSSTVG